MHQALKDAGIICKTLMRNGYDAHIINAPLQEYLITSCNKNTFPVSIDIACECDFDTLLKLFPAAQAEHGKKAFAMLEENGAAFRFYHLAANLASDQEFSFIRITPNMINKMDSGMQSQMKFLQMNEARQQEDIYEGFADVKDGAIRLLGIPDETLRRDYLLAIRALRFAANFDIPIEQNTWMAIVRASVSILDYVPPSDIMAEWRKVAAETMHSFVRLLYDAHLLQGIIPELANLVCVVQQNDKGEINGNVFEHTLKCMELYPQEGLHYDWLGTLAMLFHDIGKLYTAEFYNGRWTYFQHHKVGAKVARKILRRVHFDQADTDLICHLINQHMRFHFMMTDRGIRRFMALEETDRLIAMAKADLIARNDSFTSFNHNIKYLERAKTPEELLEPLLNGNEIMTETRLSPGPIVGIIRDALLKAQRTGLVKDRNEAINFVRSQSEHIDESF